MPYCSGLGLIWAMFLNRSTFEIEWLSIIASKLHWYLHCKCRNFLGRYFEMWILTMACTASALGLWPEWWEVAVLHCSMMDTLPAHWWQATTRWFWQSLTTMLSLWRPFPLTRARREQPCTTWKLTWCLCSTGMDYLSKYWRKTITVLV